MAEQSKHPSNGVSVNVRVQFQEFKIPPVQDALVIGKRASIGCEAMHRSLTLLHVAAFERIEFKGDCENEIVGDLLVRQTLLNKIPREKLIDLVMVRIKPFMTAEEILHLRIEAEVTLEHQI